MGVDGPKLFDDLQVIDNPKGISIRSMNFDNLKVYDDTSTPSLMFMFVLILNNCLDNYSSNQFSS